jgi:hypothetical protein
MDLFITAMPLFSQQTAPGLLLYWPLKVAVRGTSRALPARTLV